MLKDKPMLDKSKDFGIIGGTFGIARYEQNGKYYDAQGNELDNEGNELKGKQPKQSPDVPAGEHEALLEKAKALGIKSAHTMKAETLSAKIKEAEGALNVDAQLSVTGE